MEVEEDSEMVNTDRGTERDFRTVSQIDSKVFLYEKGTGAVYDKAIYLIK